jgi:hypothetical protein
MGYEDGCTASYIVDFSEALKQFLTRTGIERVEGLVEEQHVWLDSQRTSKRDALVLPA